jgi:cytidine deaminase
MLEIGKQDLELIAAVEEVIRRCYEFERHHVGAVLRTSDGTVFTAVHVEAYVGRKTVCAEAMVIGKVISEGYKKFETIVAVRHPDPDAADRTIRVVSPCGMCRELIGDYGPNMKVIVPTANGVTKYSIEELLPLKYIRT